MAMDLGLLAWNAGTSPRLGVLRDAVPDELLLQEGSCRAGRRMSEAMDEVEDVPTKLERNSRTRMTGADVAEKSGAVVCEGNIFPLKSGEGSSAGGHLRILLLKTGEELIVEAKADRGYGIPREGVTIGFFLPGTC